MVVYALRRVEAEDFAFLYALHVATMKELVTQVWGWDENDQRDRFALAFVAPRSETALAEIIVVDGRDVGVLGQERREAEWFISNIEIAPEHQGCGLGASVISGVTERAAMLGMPVTLQVLQINRARRLYERLGFVVTGETETHFLMRR